MAFTCSTTKKNSIFKKQLIKLCQKKEAQKTPKTKPSTLG